MKAILEFDLNDQDERMAHMAAVKASDMAMFLWHLRFNLRKNVYQEADLTGNEDKLSPGIEHTLAIVYEMFDAYNINVEELTR